MLTAPALMASGLIKEFAPERVRTLLPVFVRVMPVKPPSETGPVIVKLEAPPMVGDTPPRTTEPVRVPPAAVARRAPLEEAPVPLR
jgi:hypothetical protein